jgi:hypothetical protein
MVTHVPI